MAEPEPKRRKQEAPTDRWFCSLFEFEYIKQLTENPLLIPPVIKYMNGQLERCPSTGRPHWQGYIVVNDRIRSTTFYKLMQCTGGAMHAKGNPTEGWVYCNKGEAESRIPASEGGFSTNYGTPPLGSGHRTDLDELYRATIGGMTNHEMTEAGLGLVGGRFQRCIEWWRAAAIAPRETKTHCIFIWGTSRAGKSYLAKQLLNTLTGPWEEKQTNERWFTNLRPNLAGYLWQEFNPNTAGVPYEFMLRLCGDDTPIEVEYKGGTMHFNVPVLVFTSNSDPRKWYETEAWSERLREATLFTFTGKYRLRNVQITEVGPGVDK